MKDVQIQINLPNKYDAIRIAFSFIFMKSVTLSELSESNGYNSGEIKY